jgi:hypothetical protein
LQRAPVGGHLLVPLLSTLLQNHQAAVNNVKALLQISQLLVRVLDVSHNHCQVLVSFFWELGQVCRVKQCCERCCSWLAVTIAGKC